jgi:hypothetical protein
MRIPLRRGRLFAATDLRTSPPVVVISEAMARHYWPDRDPLGERIRLGSGTSRQWATIIGVVGDVRSAAPNSPPVEEAYRPNEQQDLRFMHFVARTQCHPEERSNEGSAVAAHGASFPGALRMTPCVDPLAVVGQIRDAVHGYDRTVPVAEVRSLDDVFAASTETSRVVTILLACFAALGLALGAIGIYGVISYSVGQRTRELGIRSALGAVERRIAVMIVGEGLRTAGMGILLGTLAALAAARSLGTLLYGVTSSEPMVYISVIATLFLVAVAASYFPARRAARVDPMIGLRGE